MKFETKVMKISTIAQILANPQQPEYLYFNKTRQGKAVYLMRDLQYDSDLILQE